MASKVRQAAGTVERILLPRLNSIDGELKSINARMDGELKSINTRIDAVNTRMDGEFKSINTKIDAVNVRMDETDKRNAIQFDAIKNEIRGISEKMDLVRDVEKLKLEVAELRGRRQA